MTDDLSVLFPVLGLVWLAGAAACAWAAWDLRRNGSGTGGIGPVMLIVVCVLWPLLMVTPLRWIERAAQWPGRMG